MSHFRIKPFFLIILTSETECVAASFRRRHAVADLEARVASASARVVVLQAVIRGKITKAALEIQFVDFAGLNAFNKGSVERVHLLLFELQGFSDIFYS
jgi:hypothetical protein